MHQNLVLLTEEVINLNLERIKFLMEFDEDGSPKHLIKLDEKGLQWNPSKGVWHGKGNWNWGSKQIDFSIELHSTQETNLYWIRLSSNSEDYITKV